MPRPPVHLLRNVGHVASRILQSTQFDRFDQAQLRQDRGFGPARRGGRRGVLLASIHGASVEPRADPAPPPSLASAVAGAADFRTKRDRRSFYRVIRTANGPVGLAAPSHTPLSSPQSSAYAGDRSLTAHAPPPAGAEPGRVPLVRLSTGAADVRIIHCYSADFPDLRGRIRVNMRHKPTV